MWLLVKFGVSAAIVVAVSELSKRSGKAGGLLAALPLLTILALVWLKLEGASNDRLSEISTSTFWFVLPTLPMFLAFPRLLPRLGFWSTLGCCAALTIGCFAAEAAVLRRFGVALL